MGLGPRATRLLLAGALFPASACILTTSFDGLAGGEAVDGPDVVEAGTDGGAGGGGDGGADAAPDRRASDATGGGSRYRQAVLEDHPTGYWRFGDATSARATNEVPAGGDGTYVGAVTVGVPGALAGDPDLAAGFSGTAKVTFGSLFAFTGTLPCSFEAWIKAPELGSDQNVMSKMDNSNALGYFVFVNKTTTLIAGRRSPAGNADLSWPLVHDVFEHVVITYDGANFRLYVGGSLRKVSVSTTSLGAIVNPFTVGFNESNGCCHFRGTIDEVAIYDYALTPIRVQSHFDAAH